MPAGYFVLLNAAGQYWTGRGWDVALAKAKRWGAPGRAYSRAHAAAARLRQSRRGACSVAYVPCPEIAVLKLPGRKARGRAGGQDL